MRPESVRPMQLIYPYIYIYIIVWGIGLGEWCRDWAGRIFEFFSRLRTNRVSHKWLFRSILSSKNCSVTDKNKLGLGGGNSALGSHRDTPWPQEGSTFDPTAPVGKHSCICFPGDDLITFPAAQVFSHRFPPLHRPPSDPELFEYFSHITEHPDLIGHCHM